MLLQYMLSVTAIFWKSIKQLFSEEYRFSKAAEKNTTPENTCSSISIVTDKHDFNFYIIHLLFWLLDVKHKTS